MPRARSGLFRQKEFQEGDGDGRKEGGEMALAPSDEVKWRKVEERMTEAQDTSTSTSTLPEPERKVNLNGNGDNEGVIDFPEFTLQPFNYLESRPEMTGEVDSMVPLFFELAVKAHKDLLGSPMYHYLMKEVRTKTNGLNSI